jgi:hypothetical protein
MELLFMQSALDLVDDDGRTALELTVQVKSQAASTEEEEEAGRRVEALMQASRCY